MQSKTNPTLRLAVAASLAAFLAAASVSAQDSAAAQGEERNPAEFSELGMQAFQKFEQDDLAGAIELLEQQRQRPEGASQVDLSLLGTLYLETGRAAEALAVLETLAKAETADPAVLYNAGRAAQALGHAEQAEGYFERSVLEMPLSPAARELGLMRGAQGRETEAYRLLRSWVARNMGDFEARLALIAAGLDIGRAADVGPLLEGLPEDDPRVELLRAQHQSRMGDLEGAVAILEKLRPNAPPQMKKDVLHLLADDYIAVGRSGEAVMLLAGEIQGDPRLALLLAEAQQRNGDYGAAAATLEPFVAPVMEGESPTGPIAYQVALDYGRAVAAAGRAEDALPYLEKATEMRPGDALAWKGLGDALAALGRRDEATAALEKFQQLSQGEAERRSQAEASAQDPAARALLQAQEALSRGERQKALAILRQEIALAPRDLRPRLVEVRVLLTLKRFQEALASAEAMVELFPDHPDAVYHRGLAYMALESQEAAKKDLRRVLELAPNHVPALNDLAVVLTLQGEKEEARKLLERLLELSPDNKMALDNLRRLRGDEDPR